MLILRVTGKAGQVFRLIKLLAETQGEKTLGELRPPEADFDGRGEPAR